METEDPATPSTPSRSPATVMIADMVGYSTRMEQNEELNARQAARSIELFKSLTGDYGGQVVNVSGDGILALFQEPQNAVRFATQIQNEFREQAVWGEGDPIQFRIGLNRGEVTRNLGIWQGHCVNVAARLQTMASPGGIMVTRAVADALGDLRDISLEPLGPQRLKNLSDPIEVFAIRRRTGDAPPDHLDRHLPPAGPVGQPSVAVLALDNLSGDPANDHLCLGIAEDVIANLSRFRNLLVIARHSSFRFDLARQDAGEIGRRLGVRYLLGGSLQRSGKRLRIAVQLIDTELEGVLWSDRSTIDIEELFELQGEITGEVASRLAVQIDMAQLSHEAQAPRDIRAYGLVLRGHQLVLRFTREANAHARRLFEEAIEIAPGYGRAFSAASRTHNLDWRYAWSSDPERSLDTAVDLARRAVQRDALDARAAAELGYAYLYRKRYGESLAEYTRALALNPNDADVLAEYADALVYVDQPEKSIALMERAMRLNPYYPDWYLWYLADAYNSMARPEDVIATVLRMQDPAEGSRLLAASYAHLDRMEEARAAAADVLRLHPRFTIGAWRNRPPYRNPEKIERYVAGLRKAGLPD